MALYEAATEREDVPPARYPRHARVPQTVPNNLPSNQQTTATPLAPSSIKILSQFLSLMRSTSLAALLALLGSGNFLVCEELLPVVAVIALEEDMVRQVRKGGTRKKTLWGCGCL